MDCWRRPESLGEAVAENLTPFMSLIFMRRSTQRQAPSPRKKAAHKLNRVKRTAQAIRAVDRSFHEIMRIRVSRREPISLGWLPAKRSWKDRHRTIKLSYTNKIRLKTVSGGLN